MDQSLPKTDKHDVHEKLRGLQHQSKRPAITKVARACVACCRRKKRCTGEHPCAYCTKKNQLCEYDDPQKRVKKLAKLHRMIAHVVEPDESKGDSPSDSDWNSPMSRLVNSFNAVAMESPQVPNFFATLPEVFGTLASPGFNFPSLSTQLLSSFNPAPLDVPMFEGETPAPVKAAARAAAEQLLLGPVPTPGVGLQDGGMSYFDNLFQDEPPKTASTADSPRSEKSSDQSTLPRALYDNVSIDDPLSATTQLPSFVDTESVDSEGFANAAEVTDLPMFKFFPELLAAEEKPSYAVEMALLVCYFRFIYPLIPLLHRTSIIKGKTNPKPWNSGPSPLLLFSMLSTSARFHPEYSKYGSYYFKQAKLIVYEQIDQPTVETVLALLHLVMYASAQGNMGSLAWMYVGMAVKIAQKMQLNIEPEDLEASTGVKMSWMERELRRRAWWATYFFDRQAAAGADRLCMISDRECRVSLPCNLVVFEGVEEVDHETGLVILDPMQPATFPITGYRASLMQHHNNAHWSEVMAWADLSSPQRRMLQPSKMGTLTFPGGNKLDPFGQIVILCSIFGKIMDFHDECQRLGVDPFQHQGKVMFQGKPMNPSERISHLNDTLEDWWWCLRPAYRDTNMDKPMHTEGLVTEAEKKAGIVIPSYFSAFLQVFYHSVHIILHRPRNLAFLGINSLWLASASFLKCADHAIKLTKIMEDCLKHNPTLDMFNPFYTFCIFQAGLIHCFAMRALASSPLQSDTSTQLMLDTQKAVITDITSLRVLGLRWNSANLQAELLATVAADLKLVDGFGLMMLGDTGAL